MISQIPSQKKPIHAALRIITALLLFSAYLSPLMRPLADTGYRFQDALAGFVFTFVPTVAIVFLIPVIIRGTIAEKIVAAIILLPSGALALLGWVDIIGAFIYAYFWR